MKFRSRTARLIAALAIGSTLALGAAACSSSGTTALPNGNAAQNAQQAIDDTQLAFVQPLPDFPFSQIRQNLIEIEAIQALGISSTTFIFIPGVQHPVFTCPSQGVPVPATDEIDNPVVAQWNSGGSGGNYGVAGVTVDQDDPTGVYQGDTSGTNALCLNNAGNPYDVYNEAYYITVTANAYWDQTTGTIVVTGTPVMPVCKVIVTGPKTAYESCTAPASATHQTKPSVEYIKAPKSATSPATKAAALPGTTKKSVTPAS